MTEQLQRDPRSFRVLVGPYSVIIDDELAEHILSGGTPGEIPEKAWAHFKTGAVIPGGVVTTSAANVHCARGILEDANPPAEAPPESHEEAPSAPVRANRPRSPRRTGGAP